MKTYLTAADFAGVDNATELIRELEVHLSLHYPCLASLPAGKIPDLQAILTPVIRRWGEIGTGAAPPWVAGPFQGRGPAVRKEGAHTLEPIEIQSLQALCGAPVRVAGLPAGSAPPPEPIEDLLVRRPGWPPADRGRW